MRALSDYGPVRSAFKSKMWVYTDCLTANKHADVGANMNRLLADNFQSIGSVDTKGKAQLTGQVQFFRKLTPTRAKSFRAAKDASFLAGKRAAWGRVPGPAGVATRPACPAPRGPCARLCAPQGAFRASPLFPPRHPAPSRFPPAGPNRLNQ